MLKTILSIPGKPGLYRLLDQGRGALIVESLTDKRRMPVQTKERVSSLANISMYTMEEDAPLSDVLNSAYKVFGGQPVDLAKLGDDKEALFASFAEVLPNFDRDRVYHTNVKKLYTWYNILIGAGFTDFSLQDEEEA